MKKLNAFSLMEVMTLLLILSIVAAATVPLVTKRTLSESHGWYACYHQVHPDGTTDRNLMREIRVENKTEDNAQNRIDHQVSQCYFNFPTGNPKPKVFTITAIGAGANLTGTQRTASLVEVEGAGTYDYEDDDPEIRKHHILSNIWGYMMNSSMLNAVASHTEGGVPTYRSGKYGSYFGVVKATCKEEDYTFCTPTPGEYVRTVYRLNDSDPNEFQRLKIDVGMPMTFADSQIYDYKLANQPKTPSSHSGMKTTVTTAQGEVVVEAQGGYVYKKSNSISKIIVPVYDELACKKDGLKLCAQVDGCTMNDYRVCMDSGFITEVNYLTKLNSTYPMKDNDPDTVDAFWLSNRLVHTPGIFDGQPEYEAFMSIYDTPLDDSGCDAYGRNCRYTNRKLAFGDPTLVYFEKTDSQRNSGNAFQTVTPNHTTTITHTYLGGSTPREQNARAGLVFITW